MEERHKIDGRLHLLCRAAAVDKQYHQMSLARFACNLQASRPGLRTLLSLNFQFLSQHIYDGLLEQKLSLQYCFSTFPNFFISGFLSFEGNCMSLTGIPLSLLEHNFACQPIEKDLVFLYKLSSTFDRLSHGWPQEINEIWNVTQNRNSCVTK